MENGEQTHQLGRFGIDFAGQFVEPVAQSDDQFRMV